MDEQNPYKSTSMPVRRGDSPPKRLFVSAITVFACSLVGGVLGLAVGTGLGLLVPGYYRSVYPNGRGVEFDPVAVGIGQGLTQGVALGAFVGLVLAVSFYWVRTQKANSAARRD